jgi:hypothetical protein
VGHASVDAVGKFIDDFDAAESEEDFEQLYQRMGRD